jgi:hypothetical protein
MIPQRTFIFALLVLFIAPILSAPIHIHNGGIYPVHVHSSSSSDLKRDAPMLAVNAHRNPSPLADGGIVARSFADVELDVRSVREQAKKARHESERLVSRSFWSKIKNTVKVRCQNLSHSQ